MPDPDHRFRFAAALTMLQRNAFRTGDAPSATSRRRFRWFGRPALSLRGRLVLLVLAATLPLVALGLLGAFLGYRAERENVAQSTLALARSMALRVEADHRARLAALNALALSPALRTGDLEAFRSPARTFLDAQPPGSTLGVADETGQILLVLGTSAPPGAPLPKRSNMAGHERVVRTGRPDVSDLIVSAVSRRAGYTVDAPVAQDGRVAFVLSLNLAAGALNEIVARQRPGEGWVVSVLDRSGVIVARAPNGERAVGQRATASFLPMLLGRAEGVSETTSLEGAPVLVAFSRSEPSGWSVAIGVPRAELTAPLWRAVAAALGAGGLVLLGSLTLAAMLARRITGPIASLAGLARAAAGNGPVAPPATGLREVDEVGRTLAATTAALREMNATLEGRVAEAIAERDRTWNNSRDLLLVVDAGGVFRAVSPAWTAILGWRADELVGHGFLEFIHPDDHPSSEGALATASHEVLPTYENRYRHKDGSHRWISWVAAPEGDLIYASGRDITAEKEAAQALARTEAQLRQSQKMEAVGRLTGGVAHDFNNLLTVVTGNLDLLRRRLDGATDRRLAGYAERAIEGANRAAALTSRLLAFSRQSPLQPEVVDPNKLVAGMSDLLRRTLGEAVAIETVLAGGLWRIEVDANGLESALLNLAVNARDAMPDGGKLTIETANTHLDEAYAEATGGEVRAGQYVLLSVSDTGTGMLPEVRARVFEPFFTTKPVGKGTGLGLAQVYGFAKQSSGHAAVYSEPGQGTTVKLYFPRVRRSDDRVQGAAQTDGELAPAPAAEGETILVVEDEPAVREFTVSALEEAGYRVLSAADGPGGLALLDAHPEVALLFTDVVLAGPINGRKVADEALKLRPGLPVLFTTGYTRNAIIHHGRLDEGVELLGKPFTAGDLGRRVRRLLDGAGSAGERS